MGRKTFESILAIIGKPLPDRTSLILTRNNFRLNIIPSLLKVNPSLHNALTRLSVAAVLDDEFIEQICEGVWNSQVNFSNQLVSINTNQLNSLHRSIQHRLLARAITVITGKAPGLSMAHSISFSRPIAGPSGKVLTLPLSLCVYQYSDLGYGDLYLSDSKMKRKKLKKQRRQNGLKDTRNGKIIISIIVSWLQGLLILTLK